jgi:hypothetical protein
MKRRRPEVENNQLNQYVLRISSEKYADNRVAGSMDDPAIHDIGRRPARVAC